MNDKQKKQIQQEMQCLAALTGLARRGISGISEKLNPQEATLYWMAIGWSESRVGAMRDALAKEESQEQEDIPEENESTQAPETEPQESDTDES